MTTEGKGASPVRLSDWAAAKAQEKKGRAVASKWDDGAAQALVVKLRFTP